MIEKALYFLRLESSADEENENEKPSHFGTRAEVLCVLNTVTG